MGWEASGAHFSSMERSRVRRVTLASLLRALFLVRPRTCNGCLFLQPQASKWEAFCVVFVYFWSLGRIASPALSLQSQPHPEGSGGFEMR